MKPLAQRSSKAVQGRKPDVFGVILQPGDDRLLGLHKLGHLLLSQPGLLAGLAKEYPELKVLVAQLKLRLKVGIFFITVLYGRTEIIHKKRS